jgi:hypothetical protein
MLPLSTIEEYDNHSSRVGDVVYYEGGFSSIQQNEELDYNMQPSTNDQQ